MKRGALMLLTLYQRTLAPYTPGTCRYTPTCSHYSCEAIEKFGVLRGSWLTLKRLARCHPLGGKGYDPVP
ncbi:MAG: membrane protein insertion efficiency factor YidD [Dehalococcoidia bacterium]